LAYHSLAVGIERVIDNPLGHVDGMVIGQTEVAKLMKGL
jgi:hypothetical protein